MAFFSSKRSHVAEYLRRAVQRPVSGTNPPISGLSSAGIRGAGTKGAGIRRAGERGNTISRTRPRSQPRALPSTLPRALRFEWLEAKLALDSGVVFNEIMYHPSGDNPSLEWVEIYNQMSADIDISEWKLDGAVEYEFPQGTVIPAEGYFVVAADPAALSAASGYPAAFGPYEGLLANGGEEIRLLNNSDRCVNSVEYNDAAPWPVVADGVGASLAKSDSSRSDNGPDVWTSSILVGGTPGRANFAAADDTIEATALAFDATWRYEQSGTDLGTAWRETAYDDSAWPSGPGVLYVESAALPAPKGTELTLGPQTFYFRTEFDVADPDALVSAWVTPLIDDGAVFYVNGTEIGRFNMPEGEVAYSTPAGVTGDAVLSTPIYIPTSLINAGSNTLAVEAHQHGGGSTDIVMGAEVSFETAIQHEGVSDPEVVFNEANTLAVADESWFYVELFNRDDAEGISLEGYRIETSLGRSCIFGAGDSIPYGGHLAVWESTLGFTPETGERLYLFSPDGVRILDAIEVAAHPVGRLPDGTGAWYRPTGTSPGFPNVFEIEDSVVVNEIMYHHRADWMPDYVENDEEWIELYNRSDSTVYLTGWSLADAVDYAFPAGTAIGAGEYLIVASDAAAFSAANPSIPVVGDFSGGLSNSGERILLLNSIGNPVDEVHYYDDGFWPEYADGGGSSLELRDPDADNSKPEVWAASDESANSEWQTITYTGVATASSVGPDGQWHEFIMGLIEAGEVLIDDLSVIENPSGSAVQKIQNGSFSTDDAWRFLGTHETSEIVTDPDNPGNTVLHLVATGATEHMHNHLETTLVGNVDIVNGRTYEISFKAKWIAGSPLLNTRLYFNRLAQTTLLNQPEESGTPGEANSTLETNVGPTFNDLYHSPAVPAAGEPIRVTTFVDDPDGVAGCTLWYRWNAGAWNSVSMTSYGDGKYETVLAGQGASNVMQFYVEATDNEAAVSNYPARGPESGAFLKVNDGLAATNGLHNFRILMSPEDTAYLHQSTNVMSNARLPATVIYNETEVYYDVGVRLKSSERGRNGDVRVGFNVEFNPGELFNGIHSTVAVDRSEASNPGQREYLYWTLINGAGDFISNYNDLIKVIPSDDSLTTTAILMLTRFGDELLDTQFEDGADGNLYEFELIYYPTTTVDGSPESLKQPNPDNVIQTFVRSHGTDEENYRWNFLNKINRDEDDFQPMIDFATFFGTSGTYFFDHLEEYVDVDEYLRSHALASLFGAGDSYAAGGYNHNAYFYIRPEDGKALHFAHDQDGFWNSTVSLFRCSDVQKITAQPEYMRLYYGHIYDICATTYNQSYMSYWTSHYATLLPGQDWSGHLSFINTRSNYALSQLNSAIPSVEFNITTNGGQPFTDTDNDGFVTLAGTGWVDVREVYLGDADEPLDVEWTGLDDWRIVVPLNLGENEIALKAVDFQGNIIQTDTITVTSNVDANPVPEHLRITELHYHPADPTTAELDVDPAFEDDDFEFIELLNTSTQTMDLSGVCLTDGVEFDFTDSAVTSLEPGEYVLVVENQAAFEARYGTGFPIAGEYDGKLSNGGETVALHDAFGETVHSFAYSDDAPWPEDRGRRRPVFGGDRYRRRLQRRGQLVCKHRRKRNPRRGEFPLGRARRSQRGSSGKLRRPGYRARQLGPIGHPRRSVARGRYRRRTSQFGRSRHHSRQLGLRCGRRGNARDRTSTLADALRSVHGPRFTRPHPRFDPRACRSRMDARTRIATQTVGEKDGDRRGGRPGDDADGL